jgi:nitrite reductase/ring-hydroxylating ferredoxin subunit
MPSDVVVGSADSLPEGTHRVVRAGRRELGIFNICGELYALPNLCPHQRGPLCAGRISGTVDCTAETNWQFRWRHEGEIITCPWHAQEFHVPSGTCLAYPQIRLKRFPIRIEDGEIVVSV